MNKRPPYYVNVSAKDPITNIVRMFRSSNMWFDPTNFIKKGKIIDLYIDKKNAKKYYVDISFLQEEMNKTLIK
ncbi:MAG: hypothetical protein PHF86_07945 [Candidatus Nanoarchaeia archaeon]|nr:hypothetical protein [Candidatus Nanoarchaeia archaeon]